MHAADRCTDVQCAHVGTDSGSNMQGRISKYDGERNRYQIADFCASPNKKRVCCPVASMQELPANLLPSGDRQRRLALMHVPASRRLWLVSTGKQTLNPKNSMQTQRKGAPTFGISAAAPGGVLLAVSTGTHYSMETQLREVPTFGILTAAPDNDLPSGFTGIHSSEETQHKGGIPPLESWRRLLEETPAPSSRPRLPAHQ